MFPADIEPLAKTITDRATEQGLMVTAAESCTSGLVAAALTTVSGSSKAFDRGFVTYSNEAKAQMLGVDMALIEAKGAVSEEVAIAMAQGAVRASGAGIGVSVTGIAGPTGGSAHKPVGLVHFAAAREGRPTIHRREMFGDIGRDAVRLESVRTALKLLIEVLD